MSKPEFMCPDCDKVMMYYRLDYLLCPFCNERFVAEIRKWRFGDMGDKFVKW